MIAGTSYVMMHRAKINENPAMQKSKTNPNTSLYAVVNPFHIARKSNQHSPRAIREEAYALVYPKSSSHDLATLPRQLRLWAMSFVLASYAPCAVFQGSRSPQQSQTCVSVAHHRQNLLPPPNHPISISRALTRPLLLAGLVMLR